MKYRGKGPDIDPKTVDFEKSKISPNRLSMDITEYTMVIAFKNGFPPLTIKEISLGDEMDNFMLALWKAR